MLWAQNKDKVFFTIDVQEAERPKVTVDNGNDGNGIVTFRSVYIGHDMLNSSLSGITELIARSFEKLWKPRSR